MSRARALAGTLALSGMLLPLPLLGQVQSFAVESAATVETPALVPDAGTVELLAPMQLTQPRTDEIVAPVLLQPQARTRNRAGVPLMVAGGAAFVAGIIAGGDAGTILMLGGAGVGAWGAYVYFGG